MGLALIIHEKAKIQQAVEICETGHTCRFLTMREMDGVYLAMKLHCILRSFC